MTALEWLATGEPKCGCSKQATHYCDQCEHYYCDRHWKDGKCAVSEDVDEAAREQVAP